jgi:catechol 2,3-dioxygenase-like lactoylglutathione lyase family enzyme
MPLGHLGVNVSELARSKAYYDQLMPLLGFEPFFATETEFSYRLADDKPGTWVFFYQALEPGGDARHARHRPGLQHLAFVTKTRDIVHAAHAWAQAQGAEILHEPQEFPQYHPGYYATFWLDPDGFMLEVVCHAVLS